MNEVTNETIKVNEISYRESFRIELQNLMLNSLFFLNIAIILIASVKHSPDQGCPTQLYHRVKIFVSILKRTTKLLIK